MRSRKNYNKRISSSKHSQKNSTTTATSFQNDCAKLFHPHWVTDVLDATLDFRNTNHLTSSIQCEVEIVEVVEDAPSTTVLDDTLLLRKQLSTWHSSSHVTYTPSYLLVDIICNRYQLFFSEKRLFNESQYHHKYSEIYTYFKSYHTYNTGTSNCVIKYRYIIKSPDVALSIIRNYYHPRPLEMDYLLDSNHTDNANALFKCQNSNLYHCPLNDSILKLGKHISKRYRMCNTINIRTSITQSFLQLHLKQLLIAYQLLETGGDFVGIIYIHKFESLCPFVHLLNRLFTKVRCFPSLLHNPFNFKIQIYCTGFVGFCKDTFVQLCDMYGALNSCTKETITSMRITPALSKSTIQKQTQRLSLFVHKILSYSLCCLQFIKKWKTQLYQRVYFKNQYTFGLNIARKFYHSPVPEFIPYTGKKNVNYVYLSVIPGSGMYCVVEMLWKSCVRSLSTMQRMVFLPSNNNITVVYAIPCISPNEFPNNGKTYTILNNPYARFLELCNMIFSVRLNMIQRQNPFLAKFRDFLRTHHITTPIEYFNATLNATPLLKDQLLHNRIMCTQREYLVVDSIYNKSTDSHSVYKKQNIVKMYTHLSEDIGKDLSTIAMNNSKKDDSGHKCTDYMRRQIERIYTGDFVYFNFPCYMDTIDNNNALYLVSTINQCQHFWHFMLGEYIPLVGFLCTYHVRPIHIVLYKMQINFPLNTFYKELEQTIEGVTIEIHSDMKKINNKYTALQPFDDTTYEEMVQTESHVMLKRTIAYLQKIIIRKFNVNKNLPPVVSVHIRCNHIDKQMKEYYAKHYATKHGEAKEFMKTYGTQRRKVLNMEDVVKSLSAFYARRNQNVQVIRSNANVPLMEQISMYLNTNVYILEHGAAMMFALFIQPKSTIIEIIPYKKYSNTSQKAVQSLVWISRLMGHTLHRVVVKDKFTNVNVRKVLHKLLSSAST